jgi:hypothetical protein
LLICKDGPLAGAACYAGLMVDPADTIETDFAPKTARRDTLFVTDAEMLRRMGIPENLAIDLSTSSIKARRAGFRRSKSYGATGAITRRCLARPYAYADPRPGSIPERPMTFKPPPGLVPTWVDMARLCFETCLSERTVDDWVRQGLLPAGRLRGGKLMWRWSEVDEWIERGGPEQSIEDGIRERTRAIMEQRRPRRKREAREP